MATAEKPQISRYRDRMDKAVASLKEEFASPAHRPRLGRPARAGDGGGLRLEDADQPAWVDLACRSRARSPSASTTRAWWSRWRRRSATPGLGLNPVVEGQNLRIPVPPLTEERRRDLAKLAGKYAEQQKVAVRNVRRDAMDDLRKAEKDGVISQDEQKRLEGEVQKITDEAIKRIDEALKTKEHEIMQV